MRKWMEVTENPQEKDNFFFGSLCFGMVSASGNWTE